MTSMTNRVFLDTSFFKGFVDSGDEFYSKAIAIMQKMYQKGLQLVTSNFVIDESFTLLRVKAGVESAKKLHNFFANEGRDIEVARVEARDEQSVWDWFWNDWSKLSYTDCTSFAVMKRLGLTQVATFDKHFAQAGFSVVS